jgi:hypothetical protein
MQRHIVAALTIFAIASGVGWSIASHPDSSLELGQITLDQGSERSYASPSDAVGRVRVRVSPAEHRVRVRVSPHGHALGTTASASEAPRIALAAQ